MDNSKNSWPELLGRNIDEAVEIIKSENPNLNVTKVPPGTMLTRDYRTDRVRVYYDPSNNNVNVIPRTG
jgi:hypothetical protein